jgi:Rhodopirellula transposase DDE domain
MGGELAIEPLDASRAKTIAGLPPMVSRGEVIVQTIAATTTGTGLRVHAELDSGAYGTGVKISDWQMEALPLSRHDWHGDWNYTLRPEDYDQAAGAPEPFDRPSPDLAWLCHPVLTGLPAQDWDALIAVLMTLHDQQRETSLDKRRGHRPLPPPTAVRRARRPRRCAEL